MSPECVSMPSFLEELQSLAARGLDPSEVHGYLLRTLIDPASLDRYTSFRPDRYTRNLVYKDERFELLVICWGSGHAAPIHGHEGERCWARVERGCLRFTNYREVSETPLVLDVVGSPALGRRGYLDGPADIHEVENPAFLGEPAVTLHLYSKPFAECDIYDLASGKKRRVRLGYDTVFERFLNDPVEAKSIFPGASWRVEAPSAAALVAPSRTARVRSEPPP
jgi:cysteine dioxygenase